jgi:hypothetical protein
VIVTVVPATVNVPVRLAPVLAATVKDTVPLAVPVDPAVIVMKAALLTDVHAHEVAAVTVAAPVPPSGGNVEGLGWATENEQVVVGFAGVSSEHAPAARAASSIIEASVLENVMRQDTSTVQKAQ